MPQFKYKAKDVSGKTVTGIQTSSSRESLVIELERKNLTVISVEKNVKEKKPDALNLFDNTLRGGARVGAFDLVIFCRQLSTMLVGGVPILRAIESIAYEAKNKKFKKVLYSIARDLREGKTLTEGIRKYPRTFSVLFISIVEAGEKVGSLDKMLRRLGNYLESRDRLARKLRSATTYPAFIAIFFCVAIGIITIFLIPRFQNMYSSF